MQFIAFTRAYLSLRQRGLNAPQRVRVLNSNFQATLVISLMARLNCAIFLRADRCKRDANASESPWIICLSLAPPVSFFFFVATRIYNHRCVCRTRENGDSSARDWCKLVRILYRPHAVPRLSHGDSSRTRNYYSITNRWGEQRQWLCNKTLFRAALHTAIGHRGNLAWPARMRHRSIDTVHPFPIYLRDRASMMNRYDGQKFSKAYLWH